jgi:quinol monooxygenase YgiN
MYVLSVEFAIDAPQFEAFLPLMLANARSSREDEPGCRQFDVCVDDARRRIFLYEIYDDRAAFDAHLAAPHFKVFDAATKAMITQRTVQFWRHIAPQPGKGN